MTEPTEPTEPDEPTEPPATSASVKWCLTLLGLGALVALVVRFPLK